MTVPFEQEGEIIELSAGQAFNKMMGDPDPEVRKQLFTAWETAWQESTFIYRHFESFRWVPSIHL